MKRTIGLWIDTTRGWNPSTLSQKQLIATVLYRSGILSLSWACSWTITFEMLQEVHVSTVLMHLSKIYQTYRWSP